MKKNKMTGSDNFGKKLHDRATRGKKLSRKDHALLVDWYKAQDRNEMESLKLSQIGDAETETLQNEINSTLIQIRITTEHIQEITRENSVLRQEIAAMRHQLTQKIMTQPV